MTYNIERLTSVLDAEGYELSKSGKRSVFKKEKEGFLSKVIFQDNSNTVYIYDCELDGRQISFIEVHNVTNDRQAERFKSLI